MGTHLSYIFKIFTSCCLLHSYIYTIHIYKKVIFYFQLKTNYFSCAHKLSQNRFICCMTQQAAAVTMKHEA